MLRMERGTGVHRSGTMAALTEMAEGQGRSAAGSRAGSRKVSGVSASGGTDGVQRKPSNTKGFL